MKKIVIKFYSDLQAGRVPSWTIAVGLIMIIGYLPSIALFSINVFSWHASIAGVMVGILISAFALGVNQAEKGLSVVVYSVLAYMFLIPGIVSALTGRDPGDYFIAYQLFVLVGYVAACFVFIGVCSIIPDELEHAQGSEERACS